MPVRVHIPCGRGHIEFVSPPGVQVQVVEPATGATIDLPSEADQALLQPVASPPLLDLAAPGQRVCIVFTDATRDVPDQVLVTALLKQLRQAGVQATDILLLCGVGMHRPSTPEEKRAKLGEDTLRQYRVLDSDAKSTSDLVYLGHCQDAPLWVNRVAVEADLLLATGVVEPHQYAGYSGGRKTVAIGAGGESTIAATHSPAMIRHPGVRLGNLEGNPFHEIITESARRAGLKFVINVLKDATGQTVAVAAGEPSATLEHLVGRARAFYEVQLDQQFDIVVAGVGHPKDSNIYQASRAATYVYLAPQPVLRPGGVIIIPAPCEEGAGRGPGEERFLQAMRSHQSPAEVVRALESRPTLAGEQRSYMLARVLQDCSVIFVASESPQEVRACHMTFASTLSEALDLARSWTRRDADVLVVPHSLLTVLRGPEASGVAQSASSGVSDASQHATSGVEK